MESTGLSNNADRYRSNALFTLLFLFLAGTLTCSPIARAQPITTLVPTSYVTTMGTSGGQPAASSIDILDESGTMNDWNKYVEFQGQYAGYQVFTLPTSITPSSVTAVQVKVNYQGPSSGAQTWTWQIYNWAASTYTTIGTNAGAPSWGAWTILTFNAAGTLANYVRASDGQIRLQLVSNNGADSADIDYEAVLVTYSAGPAPLTISTTSLPSGTVGTTYSTTLAATGGTTPYTWTIPSGSVPGLTLSSAGVLSGAPTTAGTTTITVQVTDSTNPTHQTASANFNVTINPASGSGSHYVSTGGSDTNAGTISSPWRHIQYAVDHVTVAGDTIFVHGGSYNERVVMSHSGNASGGPITLQSYPGETAIVDGTGVTVTTGGYAYGLVTFQNLSYVTISGLEITNFTTTNHDLVPAGIEVEGSGTNIQLLNNHIHHIYNTGSAPDHTGKCPAHSPQAFGLVVAGTSGTSPIDTLTISGNELNDLKTGCSESMTTNGNTQHFTIANNKIHDNNNIGIAALGGEGVAPSNDGANHGTIRGNSVYNITSNGNPVYGNSCVCADGIYADGSNDVIVERNLIHNVDWGIETTGEKAGQNTTNITIRSNLIYSNNAAGMGVGGQGNPGGASNITIVNNTFYNDDTSGQANGTLSIGSSVTGFVIFKNNIVYASSGGLTVTGRTGTAGLSFDYNLYFKGASPFTEAHSLNTDPQFVSVATPDLHVKSSSPAVNAGINLGSSVVGTLDVAGNPRVQGANIDLGAYEQ